ncbi:NAD(P)-binding protein [Variovorax sp. J2P1-59]|uniref:NAD(P)-binding protein n=1 Tax=Variovorax flavidus TaxID=3053501 RepID=UPI002574914A|nr:NAD(P)-binding protein [Variovorax sp. J2P1-59]MDM0077129.1 NAD(P)-binding protein [Variovorax sp. J2P1-59]
MTPPIRVAIVGGGCAGIATAWQISEFVRLSQAQAETDRKAGKGKGDFTDFQITVYEQSWRLGGKGASGRDSSGRIREHGLHIWLGFYENAFAMMRHCYDEVRKAPWGPEGSDKQKRQRLPHESFDEAFFPEPHIGVATKNRSGQWEAWSGMLPPMKGLPGTELDDRTNPFTLAGYLARCIGLSKALIHSVVAPPSGVSPKGSRSTLDESIELDFGFDAVRSPGVVIDRMARLLRVGALTTAAGVLQGATILENWLRERDPAPQFTSTVMSFMEALAAQTRRQLTDLVGIDEQLRRKTEIIDLIMTIVVGLYRDRVLFDSRGLDAINHIDCKDWLIKHGAMRSSVESPFVTGLYDLAFCYRDGDRNKPALAAGQALRGALRMFFTYRGALFWRMRSGMGDTVFAPLYQVLKDRKVDFRFMHELKNIDFVGDPDKDEPVHIASMSFETRGSTKDLNGYAPLDAAGCWSHERPPKFAKTNPSPVTLNYGKEFDVVVFAMGIDDFRTICEQDPNGLFKKLPRWNEMQKHVKTVGTQAAQVWLDTSVEDLGWRRGSALVSALDHPFESWADMTHTFAAERAWREQMGEKPNAKNLQDDATRSVSYFVGLLSDADIKAQGEDATKIEEKVRKDLQELLAKRVEPLWPDAFKRDDKGNLKTPLDRLVDAKGKGVGADAITAQHVQGNFRGSDRYTLALPGSLEHRISPLDASVVNMTIAGDWTECGFNEGCIEAAVMSGMLASHAICGFPALEDIVGYDHP